MKLGTLTAELNWISCGDPNKQTNAFKNKFGDIRILDSHINRSMNNLSTTLSDLEIIRAGNEFKITTATWQERRELELSNQFKPPNLVFNRDAIIIKTNKRIPDDIVVGLSFGWKFLFPFCTSRKDYPDILAQLEMCIHDSIPILSQHEAFENITRIIKTENSIVHDFNIQWLRFIALRTKIFFTTNKDLLATRSDKGAHTVVVDVAAYDTAIENMMNNVNYTKIAVDPLSHLIKSETKLVRILKTNYRTKKFAPFAYEPNGITIAKFYGLLKVHKTNFSLRPIISMSGAPGHYTGKCFDKILNIIFPRTNFHIKDSYSMKNFIDSTTIGDDHILISFDVVSMYTNIPRDMVIDIIMEKSGEFHSKFGIGKAILLSILKFLLHDTTVFTIKDNIYMQNNGLPMGGCISTTLARLVMDRVANNLMIKEPNISFLRIFVDDTISAMKREFIPNALKILNDFHPNMSFTHEVENDNGEINFLNLTLIRNQNSISTKWYRKPFASGRLLNYFSSHKRTIIINTAVAFIETVLLLSNPEHFNYNRQIVIDTLSRNSFPETTIMSLMNKHYTLMRKKPQKLNKNSGKRVIFPHAICQSRRIKRVLTKLRENDVIFVDSTRNTKINFIRTGKAPSPPNSRANVILISNCQCRGKTAITRTCFNENVKLAKRKIITSYNLCTSNRHAFNKISIKRGLFYKKQTAYLLKLLKWKNRKHVINPGDFPNYFFTKLV